MALLTAAPLAGATTDQDRWHAHQELTTAQDLKQKGQLEDALTHYLESVKLDPKLQSLTELAELEEQLGKLTDAQTHWAAARDKAQEVSAPRSKATAEEHIAAIDKKLAHLTLQLAADTPANAQILRDDVPVDAATLATAIVLPPGDHIVVVKAPDHQDQKYDVKLADGDNQTLAIAVGPSTAPPPPPPPPPAPVVVAPPPVQASSSGMGSSRHAIGIIASTVGVLGLGAGIPLWAIGYRNSGGIDPTSDNEVLVGEISTIAGGALLVTGVVLLVTAPSGDRQSRVTEPQPRSRVSVVPTLGVSQHGSFVGAVGRF